MMKDKVYELGNDYFEDEEYEEAYKCFLESSLNQNPKACIALGSMYLYGYYPERDIKKAVIYFRNAYEYAKKDNSSSQIATRVIYYLMDNYDELIQEREAVELYLDFMKYLVKEEVWDICITFAGEYQTGKLIPKDINKAIELFEMAANHGIGYGYHCIGEIYFKGEDVEADYEKAYEYFNKTDVVSNIVTYYYGEMHRLGVVLDKDIDKAKEYYLKLANDETNIMYDDYHYLQALERLREIKNEEIKENAALG